MRYKQMVNSMRSPKYRQVRFDEELALMLSEAKDARQASLPVVSQDLHNRVVHDKSKRMPMACNAMWKLWKKQGEHEGRIIRPVPSGQSNTLTIEFDTA